MSPKLIKYLFIFLSFVNLVFSFLVFDSMRKQSVIVNDVSKGAVSYSSSDLGSLFTLFPNVSTTTIPLINYKAYYLWQEKMPDEAINLYKSAPKINPYLHFSDYMLAQIFLSTKQFDSALFFAKKAFYGWPKKVEHYKVYNDVMVQKKDTLAIIQAYDYIDSIFANRDIYKTDFISSFAEAKIKYLVKYDSLINVSPKLLEGYWQRVLEFEGGKLQYYPNSEIKFDNKFYFTDNNKYYYSLKKDSIYLSPVFNENYVLSRFHIKFSEKYSSIILNSELANGEKDIKVFKKVK